MREVIGSFFSAYGIAQVLALPLVIYYLVFDHTRVHHDTLRRIRTLVCLLILVLPVILCCLSLFPPAGSGHLDTAHQNRLVTTPSFNASPVRATQVPSSGSTVLLTLQDVSQNLVAYNEILSQSSRWLVLGSGMGLLVLLIKWLFLAGRLSRMAACGRREIVDGVPIYHSDTIRNPFSLWLGRSWVFLPGHLSDGVYPTILAHELCHVRRNHTFWATLDGLMAHLFWYNPLVHLLRKRGDLLREVECDSEVSEMVGRGAYIDLVMNYARQSIRHPALLGSIQCWGGTVLKKRVRSLLSEPALKKTVSIRRLHYLFLGLTLLLAAMVSGCMAFDDPSQIVGKIKEKYSALVEANGEVRLSDLPDNLVQIFILREDKSFYQHHGLDIAAIARAAYNNLRGGSLQGGSTITQQVAKRFLYQDEPKTLGRKIRQIRAAQVVEKQFSKDRIMEIYLNAIYFGEGIYGLPAASLHYFGHPARDLSVAETTALAVMISRPKENSFRQHPKRARTLQKKLLDRMVAEEILTPSEAATCLNRFWESRTLPGQ